MNYPAFTIPAVLMLISPLNNPLAEPAAVDQIKSGSVPLPYVDSLKQACHDRWQQLDWKMGEAGTLASNNPVIDQGIYRVCQARAELFLEGYQLSPFIADNSQDEVYPIVFQFSVDEIKSHIKQQLPRLNII